MNFPRLETDRLILRQLNRKDRQRIMLLAGDKEIAKTTLNIPHPYTEKHAMEWINSTLLAFERRQSSVFGLVLKSENQLIGAMSVDYNKKHQRGALGYWIGKPYWNKGFATEALRIVLEYEFSRDVLNKVEACYFAENPASGRVMQKAGMFKESEKKQHIKRNNRFLDVIEYGLTREDYLGKDSF